MFCVLATADSIATVVCLSLRSVAFGKDYMDSEKQAMLATALLSLLNIKKALITSGAALLFVGVLSWSSIALLGDGKCCGIDFVKNCGMKGRKVNCGCCEVLVPELRSFKGSWTYTIWALVYKHVETSQLVQFFEDAIESVSFPDCCCSLPCSCPNSETILEVNREDQSGDSESGTIVASTENGGQSPGEENASTNEAQAVQAPSASATPSSNLIQENEAPWIEFAEDRVYDHVEDKLSEEFDSDSGPESDSKKKKSKTKKSKTKTSKTLNSCSRPLEQSTFSVENHGCDNSSRWQDSHDTETLPLAVSSLVFSTYCPGVHQKEPS